MSEFPVIKTGDPRPVIHWYRESWWVARQPWTDGMLYRDALIWANAANFRLDRAKAQTNASNNCFASQSTGFHLQNVLEPRQRY